MNYQIIDSEGNIKFQGLNFEKILKLFKDSITEVIEVRSRKQIPDRKFKKGKDRIKGSEGIYFLKEQGGKLLTTLKFGKMKW